MNQTYPEGSHGIFSHRPIVWGTHGMVGGGTQLTAQSGMRILGQGGNAVDAAVASALSAGVLEPTAHYTLGGEVAMLFYDAAKGKVRSVVGQGRAGRLRGQPSISTKTGGEKSPPASSAPPFPALYRRCSPCFPNLEPWVFRRWPETLIPWPPMVFPPISSSVEPW